MRAPPPLLSVSSFSICAEERKGKQVTKKKKTRHALLQDPYNAEEALDAAQLVHARGARPGDVSLAPLTGDTDEEKELTKKVSYRNTDPNDFKTEQRKQPNATVLRACLHTDVERPLHRDRSQVA